MANWQKLVERMSHISHFKGLKTEDLLNIIRAGVIKKYKEEEVIFHEGFDCFGLCVLLKGEVHLYCLGPDGQENIISEIQPVIMFNEVAALDGGKNPVTAIASKDSIIWHVDFDTFQYGLKGFPQLGLGLLPVLARRNRKILSKYSNLSFREVKERLILLLLELSDNGYRVIARKNYTIQEMAAHIVTSPVLISRLLGELKNEGLIDCTRQEIILLKPQDMARMVLIELEP